MNTTSPANKGFRRDHPTQELGVKDGKGPHSTYLPSPSKTTVQFKVEL